MIESGSRSRVFLVAFPISGLFLFVCTEQYSQFNSRVQRGSLASLEGESVLEILHLEQIGMRGLLPPEFALLTSLTEVRLVSNKIFGHVPSEWASLTNMRVFELRDNM